MAISIVKVWAVEVNGKYLAYITRHPTCAAKGTLRVMRGSVLIGEREVIVNAPGAFGPQQYDIASWTESIEGIIDEHDQLHVTRNK